MFGHFLVSSRNDVVTLFAFIYVQFQMSPPIACNRRCIVTLVAFMWFFAILCVFKCILKETQAKSHQLHQLDCVFSNVSSNGLPENRQSHIACICLVSLRCVFSNEFSNGLYDKMHYHIGCICLTFLHTLRLQMCPHRMPQDGSQDA